MVRILVHILILPAMLWLERRGRGRLPPLRAAGIWYLLGIPLMAVEAAASKGPDRIAILLQSLLVGLFFLPPAYLAFRHARRTGGIGGPFLLFISLSLVAVLAVALVFARAPVVRGF